MTAQILIGNSPSGAAVDEKAVGSSAVGRRRLLKAARILNTRKIVKLTLELLKIALIVTQPLQNLQCITINIFSCKITRRRMVNGPVSVHKRVIQFSTFISANNT